MHLLWALLIGLIVGALAKLLMPGKDPGGILITMLLGVGGSVFANWAGHAAGLYATGENAGLIAAVLGAIAILAFYRFLVRLRAPAD